MSSGIKLHDRLRSEFSDVYKHLILGMLRNINRKINVPVVANPNVDEVMTAIEILLNELEIDDERVQDDLFRKVTHLAFVREPEFLKKSGQLAQTRKRSEMFRAAFEIVDELITGDPNEWYAKSEDVRRFRDRLKKIADEGDEFNFRDVFRHYKGNQSRSRYVEMISEIISVIKDDHIRTGKKIKLDSINSSLAKCIDKIFLGGLRKSTDRSGIGAAARKGMKRRKISKK